MKGFEYLYYFKYETNIRVHDDDDDNSNCVDDARWLEATRLKQLDFVVSVAWISNYNDAFDRHSEFHSLREIDYDI